MGGASVLTANADLICRHQGDPLTDTELLEQPETSAEGFIIVTPTDLIQV